MKSKKIIALGLVAAMTIAMVTGCGGKKSESSNKTVTSQSEADEMVIGMNSDIIACDPAFAYDNNTNAVVDQITEGLLAYDQDNKLVSKLAKSWEQVDDVTYKYEIRDDVKFSDGTQMTADDVVFSLNRIKDPSVASYLNWMYANVDSIEKTGDWEVTVKLSTPDALWQYVPATTAGHVISQKFYEENKDDFGKPGTGIIGTGPYKFDSWTKEDYLRAVKVADYIKEAKLDAMIDIFEHPENFIVEGIGTIADILSGDIYEGVEYPLEIMAKLQQNCKTNFDGTRMQKSIELLEKTLQQNIEEVSKGNIQSVESLARQVVPEMEDVKDVDKTENRIERDILGKSQTEEKLK